MHYGRWLSVLWRKLKQTQERDRDGGWGHSPAVSSRHPGRDRAFQGGASQAQAMRLEAPGRNVLGVSRDSLSPGIGRDWKGVQEAAQGSGSPRALWALVRISAFPV